jgi:hypothetical protein
VRSRHGWRRSTKGDLIEAGLSEPAGRRVRYGDCSCGAWSEAPVRTCCSVISTSWVAAVMSAGRP